MRKLLIAGVLLTAAQTALATEVYRWVDENGVTHFTEAAFANSNAQRQRVASANGMDVPDASSLDNGPGRPSFTKISKAGKKNKDGWRGHQRRNRVGRRNRY